MPHFNYEGFKIGYEQRGRKQGAAERPIMLIHGLLLPRRHHYPLADALADQGNRVVLIDLLGHGTSDKPANARNYTMELFSRQVVALMDHLELPEAVVGGTSLGANVSLEVAADAPDRTRGILVEMPVLEHAVPAAGVMFLPLTIAYSQASGAFDLWNNLIGRLPEPKGLYPSVMLEVLTREPMASAAILHGLLTGRIAPPSKIRETLEQPALIIGHSRDLLHPFSDAEALNRDLRDSELVQANSFFELRFPPNRLSNLIADWLDKVWA